MNLRDWVRLTKENARLREQLEEQYAVERSLRLQLRIARVERDAHTGPIPRIPAAATSRPVPKERPGWTHPSSAGSATSDSSTRSRIPSQRRPSEPPRTPRRGNSPHSHGSDHTPYGGTTR